MVDDAWRAADPHLPPGAGVQLGSGPPGWVTLWWTLWVLSNFVYWRGTSTGETLQDLQRSVDITLAADVMSIAAGLLALLLVHRLNQRVRRQAQVRGQLTP
jgi:ABC-type Fe3+ transport system permease subunit